MTKQPLLEMQELAKWRAEQWPDERECFRSLVQIAQRLRELGWKEASYCPKDRTLFQALEFGCGEPGICHYDGEWPDGGWWMHDEGDLWPCRPVMFKPLDPCCPYCGVTVGLRVTTPDDAPGGPDYICEACWTPKDEGPCFDDLPEAKHFQERLEQ